MLLYAKKMRPYNISSICSWYLIVFEMEGVLTFQEKYCEASGQKLNTNKSEFILEDKASDARKQTINNIARFSNQASPFKYPGAPIF